MWWWNSSIPVILPWSSLAMIGRRRSYAFIILFLIILELCDGFRKQATGDVQRLSESKFREVAPITDPSHFSNALEKIMTPRHVGSVGHTRVREYIESELEDLSWSVSRDSFMSAVPIFGSLEFHNIIATWNANAERFLVLACHYDSKYFKFEFVGATDSAVPCAMLLNLAHVLHDALQPYKNSTLSLMLLFFDGEEAFESWSDEDSIYGARHLAAKWEDENFLHKIDVLVLLDLIGAPDPVFYNHFSKTHALHSNLIRIEDRLAQMGLLKNYTHSSIAMKRPNGYFKAESNSRWLVEDDHIPFLRRKVPILHVIPQPFPSVWHTQDDNAAALDFNTIENLSRIIRVFTMNYLYVEQNATTTQ